MDRIRMGAAGDVVGGHWMLVSGVRAWMPIALLVGAIVAVVATGPREAGAAMPRQSGPLALTPDGLLLLNVNPDASTVSVLDTSSDPPAKLAEVRVGRDPASVAASAGRAYVASAAAGTVSVLDLASMTVLGEVPVPAEPAALVLSPNATRLYVASAATSSLVVLDVAGAGLPTIVATVALQPIAGAPRAIAVSDDGDADDGDETIYVASFFGHLRPGKTSLDEGQDDQREGHVVAVSAATNTLLGAPNPIVLSPMASTGFGSNGRLAPAPGQVSAVASSNPQKFTTSTAAFPNQLAAIALHPSNGRAYVVSTGASPNGPLRFDSNVQGLVSVYDATTRLEITAAPSDPAMRREAPLNLNRGVELSTTLAPRLFLSNPVAMAWRPDGSDAWLAIQNTDLIVRLTADALGIPTIGAPLVAGPSSIVRVDLQAVGAGQLPGKAPRGIAIDPAGTRAYVSSFASRSVTSIDISNPTAPAITGTVLSTALPAAGTEEAEEMLGAELFYTGRGPDGRMSSAGWGGCITCHPNGRSDNVTWMFDAGPRQTIALDGSFRGRNLDDHRILNWSAVRDENQDFELNTRGVFGGRGLIDDDRLFLAIGGSSGLMPLDSAAIEQFDNATGSTGTTNDLAAGAALPALPQARRDFATATLDDGRVFLIGGRTGAGDGVLVAADAAVLELDPRTNALTSRSSAGFTLRHALGAAAVRTRDGSRIYAIGGYAGTAPDQTPVTTVEEYDPSTDTWRSVASLPQAVAQHAIAVAGGHNAAEPLQLVHVVGGNTGTTESPSVATTAAIQRFQADPVGPGTWTGFNPANLTLRRLHGAAAVLRGTQSRVFVIGGVDALGFTLSSVEEYVAQTVTVPTQSGAPLPHSPMPGPRSRFGTAATLSTNQIYVVGGIDNTGTDQRTVFEYTPSVAGANPGPSGTPSGTWATRGNLSLPRRSLGLSSPPPVTNFLPVASTGRDPRQDAIAAWIARRVRSAASPVAPGDAAATAGKALFETVGLVQPGFACATCHGGPGFSASSVDYPPPPSPEIGIGFGDERIVGAELRQTATQGTSVLADVGTFTLGGGRTNEVRSNPSDIRQAIAPLGASGFNPPSLLSLHETAPYFYSGLARTLEEVLNGAHDGNGGVRHHFVQSGSDRANLIAYLRSIAHACGDARRNAGEECDDGDTESGDGCTRDCLVEHGFACDGSPSACSPICGDGLIVGREACDDANTVAGDGCSDTCAVEPGYTCTGLPSACTLCGNGALEGAETCDDGNRLDGDCCSSACRLQSCTLAVAADTFVRSGVPNANEGASRFLFVRSQGRMRALMSFDTRPIAPHAITKATLVVTVEQNLGDFGASGRSIGAHALLQSFAEGNGRLLSSGESSRGSGAGATFVCASDTEIANQAADCATPWNGGTLATPATSVVVHTGATRGDVQFDVTPDARAGRSAWALRLADEQSAGAVRYWSREGAALASRPGLAPRLRIEY